MLYCLQQVSQTSKVVTAHVDVTVRTGHAKKRESAKSTSHEKGHIDNAIRWRRDGRMGARENGYRLLPLCSCDTTGLPIGGRVRTLSGTPEPTQKVRGGHGGAIHIFERSRPLGRCCSGHFFLVRDLIGPIKGGGFEGCRWRSS